MNKQKFLISWSFQILILLLSAWLGFIATFFPVGIFWIGFAIILTAGLSWVLPRIKKKMEQETAHFLDSETDPSTIPVVIVTVQHNEGKTIVGNITQYLQYSLNLKCRVYDDASTDGSFEELQRIQNEYPNRLEVIPLRKEGYQMHPQGIAWQNAFRSIESGVLLLIDADSVISEKHLRNALQLLFTKKWDAIHFSRRNTFSESAGTRIGDTDETMQTCGKILGLFSFHYLGSGILLSAQTAKDLEMRKKVFSNDSEMGRIMNTLGKKTFFSPSMEVIERAPSTLRKIISQRKSWFRNAVLQYLEHNFWALTLGSFFAPQFLLGLFSFSSLSALLLGMTFAGYLILSMTGQILIGRRSFLSGLRNALLLIGVFFVSYTLLFIWELLLAPKTAHTLAYKKNQV